MRKRNSFAVWCIVTAILLTGIPNATAAPTVLTGDVLTVGVNEYGYLINAGYGIDFTSGDGTGGRDFILDGAYPWEGYSIGVGGNVYNVTPDFTYPAGYHPVTNDTSSGTTNSAVTTGRAYYDPPPYDENYIDTGLSFIQTVSFSDNASVIDFEVVLRNETQQTLDQIVYARFLDPDQDWFVNGSFTTDNEVISENLVTASSLETDWTIGIHSESAYPQNASEYYPGISDPYTLLTWDETAGFNYWTFINPGDFSINMAWNIGTLEAGQSAVIDFQYVLGGTVSVIPAPGAFVLAGIGLGLVSWLRRRRVI